jgi:hypothetical protein
VLSLLRVVLISDSCSLKIVNSIEMANKGNGN